MNSPAAYPVAHALGWTLLHFCWQGAAVALLLWCVLGAVGTRSSRLRYAAACTALALMVALPLGTFIRLAVHNYRLAALARTPIQAIDIVVGANGSPVMAASSWTTRLSIAVDHALPWLLTAWFAGVVCLLARLGLGLAAARALRATGEAVSAELQHVFEYLRARLDISRAVELLHSARVEVPTVIGWLRPIVLLPASCLTGLAPDQIQAILCHELAHIRRHDYLVSVLQSVIETLLFYHPAVWWVSTQIRRERECCCDDFAVRAGGDVLAYARTLALLEEQRSPMPQFALGANGGVLKMRIQRLLGRPEGSAASQFASIAVLVVLAVSALGVAGRMAWAESRSAQTAATPAPAQTSGQSSTPSIPPASDQAVQRKLPAATASDPQSIAETPDPNEPVQTQADASVDDTQRFLAGQLRGLSGQLEEQQAAYYALAARGQDGKSLSEDDLGRLINARRTLDQSRSEYNELLRKLLQVAALEARTRAEQGAMAKVNVAEIQKQLAEAQAALARLNSDSMLLQMEQAAQNQAHVNSSEFRRQMEQLLAQQDAPHSQLYAQESTPSIQDSAPPAHPAVVFTPLVVPADAVRVSSGVMQGLLLPHADPVYPPIARAAYVQGVVVLHALISKEGRIESLQVISGAPMLVQSATDAVQQWTYRPYVLNGKPVEVETTVSVNFSLADPAKSASYGIGSGSGTTGPIVTLPDGEPVRRIGGSVSTPEVIHPVQPEYSEQARKAKFSGLVLVGLVVNPEGVPVNVHVVRGVGMGLDQKAVEAVSQYRFRPAMENGKPVAVALNVQVNFQVSDGPRPALTPPDMSCTYYDTKTIGHAGTCEEGTTDKGHYYCRADDGKGLIQSQSSCEWKVKRLQDWQRDNFSPAKIQTSAP